jgi:hypothetical protein
MPEMRALSIIARHILVGDELEVDTHTEIVADTDPKVKWTTVSTDYGTHKLLVDAPVTVYRVVPTEEEQAQQRHDYAVHYINSHIANAGEAKERLKAELLSRLDYKDVSYHGSGWEDYAMAQAEFEIWNAVSAVAINREIDVVEAAILVRDEQLKKMIHNSRFTHGSTNAMSNMSEAIVSEVRRRFIVDLEWVLL